MGAAITKLLALRSVIRRAVMSGAMISGAVISGAVISGAVIASAVIAWPATAEASSCDASLWVRARRADRIERVGRAIELEASIDHNGTGCGGEELDPSLVRYSVARSPEGPWAPMAAATVRRRVRFVPEAPGLWWVRAASVSPRFGDRVLAFHVEGARGSADESVRVTLALELGTGAPARAAMELVEVASMAPGARPVRVWAPWSARRGARVRLPRGEWEVRLHVSPGAAPRVARVTIAGSGTLVVPMRATAVTLTLAWAPPGETLSVVLRDARGTVHCDEFGEAGAWLGQVAPGPARVVVQRSDEQPAPRCPFAGAQIDFESREYEVVVPDAGTLALRWSAGRVLARAEDPGTSRWIDEAPIAAIAARAEAPRDVTRLAVAGGRIVAIGASVSTLEASGAWRTARIPASLARGAPIAVAGLASGELVWLEESDSVRVWARTARGLVQERLALPYGCRGETIEATRERIVARGSCPAGEPGVEADGAWRATRGAGGWTIDWPGRDAPGATPPSPCASLPQAPLPAPEDAPSRRIVDATIAACVATSRGPVALVRHRISHVDFIATETSLARWDGTAWGPVAVDADAPLDALVTDGTRVAVLAGGHVHVTN